MGQEVEGKHSSLKFQVLIFLALKCRKTAALPKKLRFRT